MKYFYRTKIGIFCHYSFQRVKVGIQILVCNINNKSVSHFSPFISVKVKKNVRKSLAQFWEKLKKLRLRQNMYKKTSIPENNGTHLHHKIYTTTCICTFSKKIFVFGDC